MLKKFFNRSSISKHNQILKKILNELNINKQVPKGLIMQILEVLSDEYESKWNDPLIWAQIVKFILNVHFN